MAFGTLRGGFAGPILHTPETVDVDLLVAEAEAHPQLVRGFGEIHGESGAWSRWGFDVVRQAGAIADIGSRFRFSTHMSVKSVSTMLSSTAHPAMSCQNRDRNSG